MNRQMPSQKMTSTYRGHYFFIILKLTPSYHLMVPSMFDFHMNHCPPEVLGKSISDGKFTLWYLCLSLRKIIFFSISTATSLDYISEAALETSICTFFSSWMLFASSFNPLAWWVFSFESILGVILEAFVHRGLDKCTLFRTWTILLYILFFQLIGTTWPLIS